MADQLRREEAEEVAKSHPSVFSLSVIELEGGAFTLQFKMKVQSARDGRKNGVLDEEPIDLVFPAAWPMKPPQIRLRKDFCRNIAHLNPSYDLDPEWVVPCIVDIPLDMFVRSEGLAGLFNQLQEWLDNVAFDNLREKDDKWEPMRRDGLPIFAIGDETKLRNRVGRNPGCQYISAIRHEHPVNGDVGQYFILSDKLAGSETVQLNTIDKIPEVAIALLAWGAEQNNVPDIFPDGYCQLSALMDAAKIYGCTAFQRTIDKLAQKAGGKGNALSILVIFAVRRPAPLAGIIGKQSSNIELLPYLVSLQPEQLHTGGKKIQYAAKRDARTYPVTLRKNASPDLLKIISGTIYPDNQKITLLGCGSLGSKIAMHLGKSGFGNLHLVDKSVILPHNLARMGVMIDHRLPQIAKVEAVEAELAMLGHAPTKSTDDIIVVASEKKKICIPDDTTLIVDTTASPGVHDTLCSYPINLEHSRISQASFFANGRVASFAIEGADRKINIEHLKGYFWRSWMLNGKWPGGDLGRVGLGEGCGSLTMTMSDMQASLLSAGISQKIETLLSQGIPDNGQLSIGVIGDDNCSVNWSTTDIRQAIPAETKGVWQVDLLPEVADEIEVAVKQANKIETGGYLLARVNWVLRRITITAQLPAPPDSIASESRFTLGTDGAGAKLQDLYEKSQKSFLACGTWHSHPKGGKESNLDLATLDKLAGEAVGLPMVSLIWRPEGYLALVKQDYSAGTNE